LLPHCNSSWPLKLSSRKSLIDRAGRREDNQLPHRFNTSVRGMVLGRLRPSTTVQAIASDSVKLAL
jgi:hypothetical protein